MQDVLSGTGPYTFNTGQFGLWARDGWPIASTSISSTNAVVTTGGTSAGNHAPQNAAQVTGIGFGDTSLEVNAVGGMIHALYVNTSADSRAPTVFPKYAAQISTLGGSANDSIGLEIVHSGTPAGGELFQINSTASQQLFKVNGPLNNPGGTVTAGGAYADMYVAGNINAQGGNSITIDPLVGNSNASLFLTPRNGGGALGAAVIANQVGALSLQPNATHQYVGINLSPTTGASLQVAGNATIGYPVNTIVSATNGLLVSGNVGIGTTTPYGILSVSNSASTPGATLLFVIASTTAGTATSTLFSVNNTGQALFSAGSASAPSVASAANPNTGILFSGTTIQFTSNGVDNWALNNGSIYSASSGTGLQINNSTPSATSPNVIPNRSAATTGIGASAAGALSLITNATDRLEITNGGNVGISTTTPWRTLSVTGSVGFDGLTGAFGAGSLCLTANKEVVYNSGSDACLSSLRDTKHDITTLNLDALTMVKALQPVSFIYNNDASSTLRYGFIAEDTAAVDSHLGTYDQAGNISGVDDRSMLAIIVKALQSLISTVGNFADSFTTKELTFTRATGDEIDVHRVIADELCAKKSDGTNICVTGDQLAAALGGTSTGSSGGSGDPSDTGNTSTSAPDTTPPVITVNGENPARINVGTSYADLGASVTDNVDHNLGLKYFLNGTLVSNIVIDTSAVATDTIDYVATDNAGNTATSTRTVIIEAPVFLIQPPPSDTTTSTTTATTTQ